MDYMPVTPLVDPVVRWTQEVSFEPVRPSSGPLITQTGLAQSKSFDLFATASGAHAPTAAPKSDSEGGSTRSATVSEAPAKTTPYLSARASDADIDVIASQRVKLMAVKYASGSASAEVVARLEILNRRLLEHAPRVSIRQVEALEVANEKLAQIRAAREERAKRFGLST